MMRLAPDGKIIWGPAAVLCISSLVLALAIRNSASVWIALAGSIPFIFTGWFFRDPVRVIPAIANAIVAPADGKIIEIVDLTEDEGRKNLRKISIFMSIFNVHVNRIPISGVINEVQYNPGKFLAAFHEKASELNEQQSMTISTAYGVIHCIQIAGLLARRIVNHVEKGQRVQTGERFGLIRFGSRVDLYVPSDCQLSVTINQKVRAGETIIGTLHEEK